MKLNIGCRTDLKPKADGWINIDIVPYEGVDMVINILGAKFEDGMIDSVYAYDILEHFTRNEANKFLELCNKWLVKDGNMYIRLPDMENLARYLIELIESDDSDNRNGKIENIMNWIYGNYGDDLNDFHKWGFTKHTILEILNAHNFAIAAIKLVGRNLVIDAKKVE